MIKDHNYLIKLNLFFLLYKPLILVLNFSVWLIISLVPLFSGLIIKRLFNDLESNQTQSFYVFIGIYVLVNVIHFIAIRYGGILDTVFRFYIKKNFQYKIFAFLIKKNEKLSIGSSEFIDIFQNDPETFEELCSAECDLINQIIFFLIAIIILMKINFQITFLILLPYIITVNIIRIFNNKLTESQNNKRNADINYTTAVKECIYNRSAILFFCDKKVYLKYLNKINSTVAKHNKKKSTVSFFLEKLVELVGNIASLFILYFAGLYYINNNFTIGDITLFITYFSYGTISLSLFTEVYSNFNFCKDTLNRIRDKLSLSEKEILYIFICKKLPNYNLRIPFDFSDSCYIKYKTEKIYKGDIIKLYSNYKLELKDILYYLDCYKYMYCVVLKINHFFNDTIHNNVTIYNEEYDINHIMNLVNLTSETLRNWDIKSKSKIGMNGELLSVGQRQRLAIARALSCGSNVIIFDDIFKNIDLENQNVIINRLIDDDYTIIYFSDNDVLDNHKKTRFIYI